MKSSNFSVDNVHDVSGDEDDDEERRRCDSDTSVFDVLQQETQSTRITSDQPQNKNFLKTNQSIQNDVTNDGDVGSDGPDDEENYNFNDQLIVLVDDIENELVIDVDSKNNDGNFDDEDLLDGTTSFARNGSITTVDVVSEGNVALHSASVVNPSVSSLVSTDDDIPDQSAISVKKMV